MNMHQEKMKLFTYTVAVMIGAFIVASIMLLPVLLFDIHLFFLGAAMGILGTFLGGYIYGFMTKFSQRTVLLISVTFSIAFIYHNRWYMDT